MSAADPGPCAIARPALITFDLDGTLLRDLTVCEVLAEAFGQLPRMREFERFTERAAIAAARVEMARWYEAVSRERLLAVVERARLAPGAEEGIARLRACGVTVAIASITWDFAVEHFADRLGVKHVLATRLHSPQRIDHAWAEDKARFVRELALQLEIPLERTAAVGDSPGDVLMLNAVRIPFYVGSDCAVASADWLCWPGADIRTIAAHVLQSWGPASADA
jgi:HAD superfamily phosphoserine phosphatase-like hydrolase